MDQRYVPAHHPLCSCELCMLNERIRSDGGRMLDDERRRAVAYMNAHGKLAIPMRSERRQPDRPVTAIVSSLVGREVRFEWARRPRESSWDQPATRYTCLAVDHGMVQLQADRTDTPMPRWWSLKTFNFIEPVPSREGDDQ